MVMVPMLVLLSLRSLRITLSVLVFLRSCSVVAAVAAVVNTVEGRSDPSAQIKCLNKTDPLELHLEHLCTNLPSVPSY